MQWRNCLATSIMPVRTPVLNVNTTWEDKPTFSLIQQMTNNFQYLNIWWRHLPLLHDAFIQLLLAEMVIIWYWLFGIIQVSVRVMSPVPWDDQGVNFYFALCKTESLVFFCLWQIPWIESVVDNRSFAFHELRCRVSFVCPAFLRSLCSIEFSGDWSLVSWVTRLILRTA